MVQLIPQAANSQKKQDLQNGLVAALEPLAADDLDKYWDRLQSLETVLSSFQRSRALEQLSHADPAKLRSLAIKVVAARPGQPLNSPVTRLVSLAAGRMPPAARLDFAEELLKGGQPSVNPLALIAVARAGEAADSSAALALLAQPDCVGIRRLIVLPCSRKPVAFPATQPGRWQSLLAAAEAAPRQGPQPTK